MRSLGSGSIGAFELGNNSWRARAQTERRQRLLPKPSELPLWPLLAEIQDLGWQNSNAVSLRFTEQSAHIQGDRSWESNYPHCLWEKGVLPFSSQWDCLYPKSEKMRKCFRNIFLIRIPKMGMMFSYLHPQNPLLISLHLLLVSSPNSSQSIFVLSYCLSYFFIAMMKYHDEDSLLKKEVIWAYGYRGLRFMLVEQRHGGRRRKLRAPILTTSRKQSLN